MANNLPITANAYSNPYFNATQKREEKKTRNNCACKF